MFQIPISPFRVYFCDIVQEAHMWFDFLCPISEVTWSIRTPLVNELLEGGKNAIFGRLSIDQVRAVREREPTMTASKTPSSRTDKVQLSICVRRLHSIAYDCQVRVVSTALIH